VRTLMLDFRGQLSWGRVCALVALIMAVIGQFKGMSLGHLQTWLSVAVGNYGASKITEMVCGKGFASVDSVGCVGTPSGRGGDHD